MLSERIIDRNAVCRNTDAEVTAHVDLRGRLLGRIIGRLLNLKERWRRGVVICLRFQKSIVGIVFDRLSAANACDRISLSSGLSTAGDTTFKCLVVSKGIGSCN